MKVVVNNDFGGIGLGVAEQYEDFIYGYYSKGDEGRTEQALIDFVEQHPDECGDLAIAEIPDDNTDWEIDEYDGYEHILYVQDGKIYRAYGSKGERKKEEYDEPELNEDEGFDPYMGCYTGDC